MREDSIPKRERDQKPTLYDNIITDAEERQMEKNLHNFIQSERLYDELVAEGKEKIDQYL